MKRLFLAIIMLLGISTFAYAQQKTTANGPKMSFESLVHDYGEITKGANGDCIFTLKNEGNEPLILSSVTASCGCTTPDWPREPIMPGKSAQIKVHYDTQRIGGFNKTITVISNAVDNNRDVLQIKGTVKQGV